ncbi:MAG TPA: molybdenum cofactor guanylyltransferase [Solirubrobacteraceae bacterium]|nr:molybdenum cofactor guanylyltransferase [Solirubrobacteraceae bacterium]
MSGTGAIAAVLAGGAGTRLGGSKPTVPLAGSPLIGYPLRAARAANLDAVVVAKPGTRLPALSEPVVREPPAPVHPACGALAALRYAQAQAHVGAVVLMACDMPFLTPQLLAWLAGLEGAVIVREGERLQPLVGRYPVDRAVAVAHTLAEGGSLVSALTAGVTRVVEEAELRSFGDPRRLLFNVNERADLELAARMLEHPAEGGSPRQPGVASSAPAAEP